MYIRANKNKVRGKEYTNYLLVESVHTEKGPRQKVICSLGNLKPAPREYWHALAKKVETALAGQMSMLPDKKINRIVNKISEKQLGGNSKGNETPSKDGEQIAVDRVTIEQAREAGPVHAGHQMWLKLGLDQILKDLKFSKRECALTEILTLSRLVAPGSDKATREWLPQTALPDILGEDNCELGWKTLYQHLDRLHEQRSEIEEALATRESNLFNFDDSLLLYDLTSTYFEGQCLQNDQAQRGYSRDKRSDCKQVVVGLVLNGERFPKAHEVFDGNTVDTTTVDQMLDILDSRAGGARKGRTVVVDRGMSSRDNLATIKARGYHYIVAMRQQDRDEYLAEMEDSEGWSKHFKVRHGKYWDTVLNEIAIKRISATAVKSVKERKLKSAKQKFGRVRKAAELAQEKGEDEDSTVMKSLKAIEANMDLKNIEDELDRDEQLIICVSQGRAAKDKAIREKKETKLLKDLEALKARVHAGKLKSDKVHENIGRLKERYPRVARYYDILFDDTDNQLSYAENAEKKEVAKQLDGSYIIRTDRHDMSDQEIWQTYMLLTRVESAFRDMKTPLAERPIFHQLEHRVQTHIFICVLAYHLLALVEKLLRDKGISTSWETVCKRLKTHQIATVVMPSMNGKKAIHLRRGTTPEECHTEIYDLLDIPHDPIQPRKSYVNRC